MSSSSAPAAPDRRALLQQALVAVDAMQARLDRAERARNEPIAIVGMGCRFPGGANDPASYWRLLRDGVDAVSQVPSDRFDVAQFADRQWYGGFLDGIDRFDPTFFGISPREAETMDPQQRLVLEVAWEALENAAQPPDKLAGTQTGVFVGITTNDYARLALRAEPDRLDVYTATGGALNVAAGRLAYTLGLHGPSMAVDTACSSSLVAVHLACQSLRNGESDLALAAGVNVLLAPEAFVCFSKWGMMAPDGRCKAFDAAADGFVRGEGCGVVVLKRLSDALAQNDRILAVIRGSAVNQDGASSGLTVPNGPAQAAALRAALSNAGVQPSDVDYVEAHGTGTSLGDPIEVEAIGVVLGEGRGVDRPLTLGSAKTNLGHLESAAGIAGLIKTVLVLQHGQIPPHLHLRERSPRIPWPAFPVVIPTELRAWPASPDRRRIAGVSAFGFSGTNAHVVLEEAPAVAVPTDGLAPRPSYLVPLAGRSESALRQAASRLAEHLAAQPDLALADVAYTSGAGRAHAAQQRLAVVAYDTSSLQSSLLAAAAGEANISSVLRGAPAGARPKVAFIFPGQGAQRVGMGAELFAQEPVFHTALLRCAALLEPYLEIPLLAVLYPDLYPDPRVGSETAASELLRQTAYTQPALFSMGYALAEQWRAWGIEPAVVLGHSVGELAAACVAGVFELEDGLRLVAARGRVLQALPSGGAMAAVRTSQQRVAAALRPYAAEVSIAAINAPDQIVLSGAHEALERVLAELLAEDIVVTRLAVSHAFHSPLVDPALDELEQVAAGVPARPAQRARLIGGLQGQVWAHDQVPDARYWRRHTREAVQFGAAIAAAHGLGCDAFIELGPGASLLGAARANLTPAEASHVAWLASLRGGQPERAQLLHSLGALYVRGADVRWAQLSQPGQPIALPTTPFERKRYWLASTAPAASVPAALVRGQHPLLGRRLPSALAQTQFEAVLSATQQALLHDHRVAGVTILPAAGFIEMALAAARSAFGSTTHEVADFEIEAALVVGEGPRRVQLILEPLVSGAASFRIASCEAQGYDLTWTTHATGILRAAPEMMAPDAPPLDELRARCGEPRAVQEHYDGLRQRGLDLGPSLQSVRELGRRDGEAVGYLSLPAQQAGEIADFEVHPALLDAALQLLGAALPANADDDGQTVFLPIRVERIRVYARPSAEVWGQAQLDSGAAMPGETLGADVRILDGSGRVLAELVGVRLKRAGRDALSRLNGERPADWLYEIDWRPMPRADRRLPSMAQRALDLTPFQAGLRHLDILSAAHATQALNQLGWRPAIGEHVNAEELGAQLGIVPRYVELLGRFLEIFGEDGLLSRNGAGWRVDRWPDFETAQAEIEAERAWLAQHSSALRGEIATAERCGVGLFEVLAGRADALQLLFPDGSIALAEQLYRESPFAQAHNALVAETIAGAIASRPPGERVRILEIGAGTGGTTSYVIPLLPAERTEYVFTDVSPLFLGRARSKFASATFMQYRTLDIENDPSMQGFAEGDFDVILAANVLHATGDVVATLERVRRFLAPDGVLVLQEMVGRQRWVDISFGLTPGWWKFRDRELRPNYPLLARAEWLDALKKAGLGDVSALPGAIGEAVLGEQAIMLARPRAAAPGSEGAPQPHEGTILSDVNDELAAGHWLVFGDATGVGDRLVAALRARGGQCDVVRIGLPLVPGGNSLGQDDTVEVPEPAEWRLGVDCSAEDVREVLRQVAVRGAALRGVVHLWNLDVAPFSDMTVGELERAQRLGCGTVLSVVQALAAEGGIALPRLWLVTRGGQAADGLDSMQPFQAPVWGLANTVALEHPELQCVCIDLDPSSAADSSALLDEILAPDAEDQVAYRGGTRHAARLVRRAASVELDKQSLQLETTERGTLENLVWRPLERRAPGNGEVEIRVAASGLNFKDVLNALGMYPGEPGPLGGECAGTIVRIGPEVSGLHVGQAVLAVAPGSLRGYVTTPSNLVASKPTALSFEAAATLPIAFVTASYALERLARLRGGERVLIHAAAGGVGLAAVQIAQRIGAEIFATAGSAEKRAYLERLGVAHVLDSRSLDFAAEIMARTAGRGVDVVLNSLANEFIPASLGVLTDGGRFLELGKRGLLTRADVAALEHRIEYFEIDWGQTASQDPALIRSVLLDVLSEVEAGHLHPLPLRVFPMDEAASAFRFMAQAKHTGKLAVSHAPVGATVRRDGTYLITGGLSGLGLLVAEWLAERGACNLVLMGRRGLTDEAAPVLERLERLGVRTVVARGNVANTGDVARVLADIKCNMPALRGIVHSAGALDDGVLAQQDWSRFEHVLSAKVDGAWHLHAATADLRLDFFVLFSSIASLLGSAGQGNHAAANAFLDCLAHARRAAGKPALSINWGAWSTVGAAVERGVTSRLAERGFGSLQPQASLRLLDSLLKQAPPQVVVVPINWAVFARTNRVADRPLLADFVLQRATSPAMPSVVQPEPGPANLHARLADTPPRRRRALVLATLQDQVGRVLNLEPGAVDTRVPLSEMGLDSLMAVELRNVLRASLGVDRSLPTTLAFDYPTLERIADFLLRDVLVFEDGAAEANVALTATEGVEPEASLDTIEELSDDEVDRLFALRLGTSNGQR